MKRKHQVFCLNGSVYLFLVLHEITMCLIIIGGLDSLKLSTCDYYVHLSEFSYSVTSAWNLFPLSMHTTTSPIFQAPGASPPPL